MPFFEPIEPRKRTGRRRRRRGEPDRWRPPETMLPAWLPGGFELARSDEMVVAVASVACYPTGVGFGIRALSLFVPDEAEREAWIFDRRPGATVAGAFRFGVELGDGTRLELDRDWSRRDDAPTLISGGGGGGGGAWSSDVWLAPLPPEGPLWLVCEWPAMGVEETRKRLDAGRLNRAAAKAKPLL